MAYKTRISNTVDSKGKPIDMDARTVARDVTDNKAFATIPAGFYDAVVVECKEGKYRAKSSGNVNPNAKDGLWEYVKAIPDITILNENGTKITRQDFTIGVIENGEFIRPDGKPQSPIWTQGQWLLTALGCFTVDPSDPTAFNLDFDPELIHDQVIRVKTGIAAYIKEPHLNFDVVAFTGLLSDMFGSDKYTFSDIGALVERFNKMTVEELVALKFNARDAELIVSNRESGDGLLKTKNVIQAVFPVTAENAAEKDWCYDDSTGAVFTNPAAWALFMEMKASSGAPKQPF